MGGEPYSDSRLPEGVRTPKEGKRKEKRCITRRNNGQGDFKVLRERKSQEEAKDKRTHGRWRWRMTTGTRRRRRKEKPRKCKAFVEN